MTSPSPPVNPAATPAGEFTPTQFQPKFVPRRLVDLAAVYAVLSPLKGALGDKDEVRIWKTFSLLQEWRQRLVELREAGWQRIRGDDDYSYHFNCLPNFVAMSPQTRCCRSRSVCPWCYGRQVTDVYEKISAIWPDPYRDAPEKPAYTAHRPSRGLLCLHADEGAEDLSTTSAQLKKTQLVELQLSKIIGVPLPEIDTLLKQSCANRSLVIEKLSPIGALVVTTVEPTPDGPSGFQVQHRYLFMFPGETALPEMLTKHPDLVVKQNPTRTALQRAISRVHRYPAGLLRGDARAAVNALSLMAGKRLREAYGVFREREKESDE